MKIVKVEVLKVKTLRATWRPVFCRIYSDEGIYGDGEAALAYGQAAEAGFSAVKEFAGLILGMDPLKNEMIWEKLYRTTFWAQNGGPVIFAAIGALDMALWDLKGKALGVPVHTLLGGACRNKLRAYASQLQNGWDYGREQYVFQTRPEGFADAAKQAVKEGYDAVKFDFFEKKPNGEGDFGCDERMGFVLPRHLHMLEERLAAVREAVGPEVDIIAEAHSRMETSGAIRFAKILKKYDVMFFEEPDTPSPYLTKYIADEVDIPLAGGERIYGRWQFVPYFEEHSLQIIQPDLGNCGGFTEVKIPGHLVDAIVVVPNQPQLYGVPTSGFVSGRYIQDFSEEPEAMPLTERKVIARRALMEVESGYIGNVGVGICDGIGVVAKEEGVSEEFTLTVETGIVGGVSAQGIYFGASVNARAVVDMPSQFDFYDGGGLDISFLSFAEFDEEGNVNVHKFNGKIMGTGGFVDICQNSRKAVFAGTLKTGGLRERVEDGKIRIDQEGRFVKAVKRVPEITFNGKDAVRRGQEVLFITERAVFRLEEGGLVLTEVAPGMDLEKDIFSQMAFRPRVSENLKEMDPRLFRPEKMGVRQTQFHGNPHVR